MRTRPDVPTKQYDDCVVCVSYTHAAVVLRLWEIGGQLKPESTVIHTGYQDQLSDHLLALAWVLIN